MPQLDFPMNVGHSKLDIGRLKKFIRSDISAFVQGLYPFCWWKLLIVKGH